MYHTKVKRITTIASSEGGMSSSEPGLPPQIQINTGMGPCALLNEFFEQVPEAIVFVDGRRRVVRANQEFVRMFGYAPEEIIGTLLSSLIVPPDLRDEADQLTASMSQTETVCSESVCVRKGGQRFETHLLEGPLCISGQVAFKYIVFREIADREQIGNAQAEPERDRLEHVFHERDRLRLLLDLNNRVAAHCGLRQVFQAISSELRRLFKCECVGLALPDASDETLRQHLIDFPEGKGHFKEGTIFPVEGSAAGLAYRRTKAVVLNSFSEVKANWNSEAFRTFSTIVQKEGTESGCFLPLMSEGRALGVLQLISRREYAFAGQDVEFLDQVANQIAITLKNALKYDEVTAANSRLAEAEERSRNESLALREQIERTSMFEDIVGSSPALRSVLSQVGKVAPSDSTVLILGETGTGKELIARAIHKRSMRAKRAFIAVNCSAIPPSLIASELFGHEKGAFTGATQRRLGRFEAADGGTIFLDEVGDVPPEIQVALLRVLQEREIERVGSDKPIPVQLRVVAATHRDLNQLVAEGKFRQDLLYRLNVVPINVPSLRERTEDIPLLVEYFVDRYGKKSGKKFKTIDRETLKLFQEYNWPGNIRELQNVIERAVILSEEDTFLVDETWLKREQPEVAGPTGALNGALLKQEKEMIEAALADSCGCISGPMGAATKLKLPRATLEAKIKRLGIDKYRFKVQPSK
ncbi:Fis family NifA subfamily transcriptional regulator [Edaphobacter modestus]|uniref:Fis family NifA subfamily transcriptional regulator n=1 Tax=Edaphobacter modestus TaxID=388466 RepID=A0A4Q7XZC1_9BACT|nr:Fis family NifA subfamily transcriptional regulator [Edaphobacter modestus]